MKLKEQSGKPENLRQHNRYVILRYLTAEASLSQSALAKLSGLALPSVMRIVAELEAEGVVYSTGKGESTGGRKPQMVSINPQYRYLVGIELAMSVKIILTDFLGQVLYVWESDSLLTQSPEAVMSEVLRQVYLAMSSLGIRHEQVAGIGIGTPGSNFKLLNQMPRAIVQGWECFDVWAWMKGQTQLPVYVENVAKTNALAELWFGSAKSQSEFLYVYLDRGVGAVLYRNGEIQNGAHNASGEFGHMGIDPLGRPCYCGKRGCIEMYVSAGAILNRLEADGESAKVCEAVGLELGYGLSNLINVFNPQSIIMGGSVTRDYPEIIQAAIPIAQTFIFNNRAEGTPIQVSTFDASHSCIGSAALVQDQFFRSL